MSLRLVRDMRPVAVALSAVSLAGSPALAAPHHGDPSIRFEKIVDSRGGVLAGFGIPAINNSGTVAFGAWSEADVASGIFTTRKGDRYRTIVLSGDRDLVAFGPPSINNAGTVAFEAVNRFDGTSDTSIWAGNRRDRLRRVVTSEGGSPIFSFGLNVSINDRGTVAFHAHRRPEAGGGQGIFVAEPGAESRAVATTSDQPQYALFGQAPHINDWGTVVFNASRPFSAGGGSDLLVGNAYMPSWCPVAPQAAFTSQGPDFGGFGAAPTINEWGSLGFSASIRGFIGVAPTGVFVAAGPDQIATIATTKQQPFGILRDPVVNNRGTVVFHGFRSFETGGRFALFARWAGRAIPERVIGEGDKLFGERVEELRFFRGLNDRDEVAFYYELEGGDHGIAIAELR